MPPLMFGIARYGDFTGIDPDYEQLIFFPECIGSHPLKISGTCDSTRVVVGDQIDIWGVSFRGNLARKLACLPACLPARLLANL